MVRTNLEALLRAAEDGRRSGPVGVLALEADSGVAKSTIYRILDAAEPQGKLYLDTVSKLAGAYGLEPWQLLVPHLDPLQPPVVLSAAEREEIAVMRVVFNYVKSVAGNAITGQRREAAPGSGGESNSNSGSGANSSTQPPRNKPSKSRPS